jgi:hypothetical protein
VVGSPLVQEEKFQEKPVKREEEEIIMINNNNNNNNKLIVSFKTSLETVTVLFPPSVS